MSMTFEIWRDLCNMRSTKHGGGKMPEAEEVLCGEAWQSGYNTGHKEARAESAAEIKRLREALCDILKESDSKMPISSLGRIDNTARAALEGEPK